MLHIILIFFGFLFFPGYFISRALFPERISKIDRFSVTILLSIGVNTLLLFYLGLINQVKVVPIISSWIFINGISLFFYIQKNRNIFDFRLVMDKTYATYLQPKIKLTWKTLFLIYCAFIVLLQFYISAFFPFYSWDAVAAFNLWGLWIADSGRLDAIGKGYPLLWPISYAWFYVLSGERNEQLTHLLSPIFGLIALLYSYRLSEKIGGNGVLTITFLLSTPLFIHHLNAGYTDLPFSTFIIASVYYTMLSLKKDVDQKYLLLAGLMLGFAFSVKNRGIYFIFAMPLLYAFLMRFYYDLKINEVVKRYSLFFGVALLVSAPYHLRNHFVFTNIEKSSPILGTVQATSNVFSIGFTENVKSIYQLAYNSTPSGILFIYLIGIIFTILFFFKFRPINMLMTIIVLPYFMVGTLNANYEFRFLIHILPLLSVQSSTVIWKLFLKFSELDLPFRPVPKLRTWIFFSLLILVLLLPMKTSAQETLHGNTIGGIGAPTLSWMITHPLASEDEKLEAILGDMYKTVIFLENNESFHGRKIVINDLRMGSYSLPMIANGFLPHRFSELEGYDYLVFSRSLAHTPWNINWRGSEVERSLRDPINSSFTPIYTSGDYTVYKINNDMIRHINNINIGESKVHPIFSPFFINYDTQNYVWIEGEDDTHSFGKYSDEAELYGTASDAQHHWLKGKGSYSEYVFNIKNSGNYTIWMRLAGWGPINVSLGNISFKTIRPAEEIYKWYKIGETSFSNITPHTLRIKSVGDGYAIYDVIFIIDDLAYVPEGIPVRHKQPIKAEGKPNYTIGKDTGYYIWQDGIGWHIRWTSPTRTSFKSPDSHEFRGEIIIDGMFENIKGYTLENNDYIENNNTIIKFNGATSGDEDGIDFEANGTFIMFNLSKIEPFYNN